MYFVCVFNHTRSDFANPSLACSCLLLHRRANRSQSTERSTRHNISAPAQASWK